MSLVALICLYDHRALGLRAISNALQANGHESVVIHFKLPTSELHERYQENPSHYEALHTSDLGNQFGIRRYNLDTNPWTKRELSLLKDVLMSIQPQIIGISTRSAYEGHLLQLMSYINSVNGAVTVAGGFGATFSPEVYKEMVDCVCIGEGVLPMVQIADAIDRNEALEDIGSLVYVKNGRTISNPLTSPNEEDSLYNFAMTSVMHYVIENDEILPADILLQNMPIPHDDAASYHTMAGLGCLNNCTYCCAGQMVNLYSKTKLPKRRLRTIENIIDELKFAKGYGFKHVTFLDSFLVASRKYLLNLFARYKQEVGLNFFAQFLPRQIIEKPDILEAAVKAGLAFTVIGIQSGSDRINREIFNRLMPNREAVELANLINQYDSVDLQYHLITHNPFVGEAEFQESLELIKILPKKKSELVLIRLRAFPGTRMATMIESLPISSRGDSEQFHKQALFYLMRYFLPDKKFDDFMSRVKHLDFDKIREICKDTIPKRMLPIAQQRFGDDSLLELGIDLYEARREQFGPDFAAALDEWLGRPSYGKKHLVDLIYEKSVWSIDIEELMQTEVDLSGSFYGMAWGKAESNVHGQNWRWIGQNKESTIFIFLKPAGDYLVETQIHTAIGEALFAIFVEVNGVEAESQAVVQEGDLFLHRCTMKEGLIKQANGKMKISYKLKKDGIAFVSQDISPNDERLVALNRVRVCMID